MRAMWMMPLALLANSAALADTPPKRGFDASDLAAAAGITDTRRDELTRETERLRLAMAYDTALGLSTRSEAERAALLAALPTGEGAGDLRVQWFMAGAIAQPSKGLTTILYHPLARGTLAIDWMKDGDDWRITHAWLSSSGPAQWPAIEGPWRKAFAEDYAKARAWQGDEGRDWAGFESDRWLAGLAEALRDPARRKGIDATQALIRHGQAAKAGGGAIDLMPERVRATYSPIAAIGRKDGGGVVLFGSPLVPEILITADFAPGTKPIPKQLTIVNLGAVK